MVWFLLLAHFLADYPLQTNWIVRNKKRFGVLLLHVAIHLAAMLVIVGRSAGRLWPYLLALAAAHLLIDAAKNKVNALRPQWVAGPYIIDQLCHYLTIFLTARWIAQDQVPLDLPFSPALAVYLMAYLVVTYTCYISEWLLTNSTPRYQQQVVEQAWPRMLVRALLLTFLLAGGGLLRPVLTAAPALPLLALTLLLPYGESSTRVRAILTDLTVSTAAAILVLAVTWTA